MLIHSNYVIVIRQNRCEFLKDFLNKKFQIPMYISHKIYQGLTGFPMSTMSKQLDEDIKVKINHM